MKAKRGLFIGAGLGAILSAVLWFMSSQGLYSYRSANQNGVGIGFGGIAVVVDRDPPAHRQGQAGFSAEKLRGPAIWRPGFDYTTKKDGSLKTATLFVPWWIPTGVFVLVASLSFRPYLHGRRSALRKNDGHCVQCGYDLTGSPVRCPECFTAAPSL